MNSAIRARYLVIWEKALVQGTPAIGKSQILRRFTLEILDKRSHNRTEPSRSALFLLKLLSRFPNPEKSRLRFFLTRLLPFSPLKENPSTIEIFIFTSAKDLVILPLSIVGASQAHEGSISKITIVAPSSVSAEVNSVIARLKINRIEVSYLSDEKLLKDFNLSSTEFVRGNIKMEIVKVLAGLVAQESHALLIDGDTVLLRKRNWATKNRYLIMVAQEFSTSHINYDKSVLHKYEYLGLGFVTHHQLLRIETLRELVQSLGGVKGTADSFNSAATKYYSGADQVFPSEWQLIGDFQSSVDYQKTVFANFSNLGLSRQKIGWLFDQVVELSEMEFCLNWLRNKSAGLGSISFHGYKTDT